MGAGSFDSGFLNRQKAAGETSIKSGGAYVPSMISVNRPAVV